MNLNARNLKSTTLWIREFIVSILAALTLVLTAWSFGGYETWSLHLLSLCSFATFLTSIIPMPSSWNNDFSSSSFARNIIQLILCPFFIFGLLFLGYILIQYYNPSVVQVFGEKSWWVEAMLPPFGERVPSSVKAKYESMNALRAFVINASAISVASGILVGIKESKSVLIILWAFIISGVTLSIIAIIQKFSGTEKLLWIVDASNTNPWGTFAYRNQGAAFLILVLLISGLLYFFYLRPNIIKSKCSGLHFLIFTIILIISASIWLSLSRSGIILGGLLFLLFLILVASSNLAWSKKRFLRTMVKLFLILFLGGIFIFKTTNWNEVKNRANNLEYTIKNIESYDRYLSSKATWEMAKDRLIFGWGGGSFRYIFPIYQIEYEQLWSFYDHRNQPYGRKIYNYAHNDWIQFLAEYGIFGVLLISGLILCLLANLSYIPKVSLIAGVFMVVGITAIFLHNLVDFIFSSPSYWIAFFGSLMLIGKLYYLEFNADKPTN